MTYRIEKEFYPSGFLKKHIGTLNGSMWGPQIDFEEEKLGLIEIRYDHRLCGTRVSSWHDQYERDELYFNPTFKKSNLLHSFHTGLIIFDDREDDSKTVRMETRFDREELSGEIKDFCRVFAERLSHLIEFGSQKVFDLDAELTLCIPKTGQNNFRSDNLNQLYFANGEVCFYGYIWEEEGHYWWNDETVSFWENGAVRATSCWDRHGIRGTRSCFSPDGHLTVEQFFGLTGWETGSWVNRFYQYDNDRISISRIEIFKNHELFQQIDAPIFHSFRDDVELNHFVVPEYMFFEEY